MAFPPTDAMALTESTIARTVLFPDTGHWLMEERPQETIDALMTFFGPPPDGSAAAHRRLYVA